MRASILALALLSVTPALACKAEQQLAQIRIAKPFRVAVVADDHPWVIAFLTELDRQQPTGVTATLEGRRSVGSAHEQPEPVISTFDRELLGSLLRDHEAKHARPPELLPVWESTATQHDVIVWRLYFIDTNAGFELDGEARATLGENVLGQPAVKLQLSERQSQRLGSLSAAAIGERLAFVHDGEVVMAPIVVGPFSGSIELISPVPAKTLFERLQAG
ncbi:MAG TPA: hypothetical protein VM869_32810 [Enhygromyxa sp.]|nr:hypothetical protein [Enhygromyxa sp.]